LRSEARHFQDYLGLAEKVSQQDFTQRVVLFGEKESALVLNEDIEFRFHSGVPT
jgi:tRNA-(ms[2]io[6]A)-hydroxylase